MTIDKKFYKTLLIIALPAAFQALIRTSVSLLDNVMVGSLGDLALSSTALGNQFTVLFSFLVTGISGGSSVLLAQYLGKNDIAKVKSIFVTVLQFTIVLTAIITAVAFFFPQAIMSIFTADKAMIVEGAKYLKIASLAYVIYAITDIVIAMLRCNKIVKIGFIVSITSFVCNLVFNYIFIFGKLGVPAMGIQGAAIATVLARVFECIFAITYLLTKDKKLNIKIKEFFMFSMQSFKEFVKHGLPIVVGDVQWGIVLTIKAALIGHLGVTMVAANSIADMVLMLAMIFTNGLSVGATVVIGETVGAKDYVKTRKYSNKIQVLFAIFGVCISLILILLRGFVPMFYNVSDEVANLAVTFLLIGGITSMGTCYHAACFVGINRGAGDGKFVVLIDMLCGWLVVIPLTYITGYVLKLPLPLVFLAARSDQCFKWIIAFFRLRGNKWIRNVTVEDTTVINPAVTEENLIVDKVVESEESDSETIFH